MGMFLVEDFATSVAELLASAFSDDVSVAFAVFLRHMALNENQSILTNEL
jgi:hypothetical protein